MGLEGFPGWTSRCGKTFERWRQENLVNLDQWEKDNLARAKYREEVYLVTNTARTERIRINSNAGKFNLSHSFAAVCKTING